MALKKLVEVEEKFFMPKKARLGAPPPVDDVLDNVGEAGKVTRSPVVIAEAVSGTANEDDGGLQVAAASPPVTIGKKRERSTKRAPQVDRKATFRQYRKTGRIFSFTARVTPEFASAVRAMAEGRNVTVGEVLEEMRAIYESIRAVAADRKLPVSDLVSGLQTSRIAG